MENNDVASGGGALVELESESATDDVEGDRLELLKAPFAEIWLERLVPVEVESCVETLALELVIPPVETEVWTLEDEALLAEIELEEELRLVLPLSDDMLRLKLERLVLPPSDDMLTLRLERLALRLGRDIDVEESEGTLMLPVLSNDVLTDAAGMVIVVYDAKLLGKTVT